jgi:hypothetical protein
MRKNLARGTPPGGGSHRVAMFDFFADSTVPVKPHDKRQAFKDAFCVQITKVEAWAAQNKWPVPSGLPRLKIFIGEHYALARSLVPAWEGDRGRMEFPARRVNPDPDDGISKPDMAHEIVHVYFPNGNRMLAEGIAIYVQDEAGINPGYPNFKTRRDKKTQIHEKLKEEIKCTLSIDSDEPTQLRKISLRELDKIHTPKALEVPEDDFDFEREYRIKLGYLIAGSFVRYLIEKYGMDKFRDLYARTQFEPGRRIARTNQGDWVELYGRSLHDLEKEWKKMISMLNVTCPS